MPRAEEACAAQALLHHQRQPTQRQQQAGETRRTEASLDEYQRQDRLHAENRGQHAGRHAVLQGKEVTDRITADQGQPGNQNLPATTRLRQELSSQCGDRQQGDQRQGEAQGEDGKGGTVVQRPA